MSKKPAHSDHQDDETADAPAEDRQDRGEVGDAGFEEEEVLSKLKEMKAQALADREQRKTSTTKSVRFRPNELELVEWLAEQVGESTSRYIRRISTGEFPLADTFEERRQVWSQARAEAVRAIDEAAETLREAGRGEAADALIQGTQALRDVKVEESE